MMNKFLNLIGFFFITIILNSCITIDRPEVIECNVTYLRNTLDYPIDVQSFYLKYDTNNDWCMQEPIAWSDPITIQPNDYALIQDYVLEEYFIIYKTGTKDVLLNSKDEYVSSTQDDNHSLTIDYELASILSNSNSNNSNSEYIFSEKYLANNISLEKYPIGLYRCQNDNIILEERQNACNGYAILNCIKLKPEKFPKE